MNALQSLAAVGKKHPFTNSRSQFLPLGGTFLAFLPLYLTILPIARLKPCYSSVFRLGKLKVKLFTCVCSPFVRRTIIHNPFSRTINFIKLSLTKIVRVLLFLTQWSIPKKRQIRYFDGQSIFLLTLARVRLVCVKNRALHMSHIGAKSEKNFPKIF